MLIQTSITSHALTQVYVYVCGFTPAQTDLRHFRYIFVTTREQSILLFFHLIFFPAILFLITYYAQYFAQNLPILCSINKILLEYLKLKNTCDCSVKIFHNLATVLLEYLDL